MSVGEEGGAQVGGGRVRRSLWVHPVEQPLVLGVSFHP